MKCLHGQNLMQNWTTHFKYPTPEGSSPRDVFTASSIPDMLMGITYEALVKGHWFTRFL